MCESLKLLIISSLIFKCVQGRSIALMALVFFSLIIVGRVLILDSENSHVIWFDQWDIVTKYDASRVLSYLLLYEKSSQNIVIDQKNHCILVLWVSSLGLAQHSVFLLVFSRVACADAFIWWLDLVAGLPRVLSWGDWSLLHVVLPSCMIYREFPHMVNTFPRRWKQKL